MAKYTGQNGVVQVGSPTAVVGQTQNFSVEETADTADCTTQGQAWKENAPLQNSFSGSITALWDPDDAPQASLQVGAILSFVLKPAGHSVAEELVGDGIITSVSTSSPMDGLVSYEVGFTGTGALTKQAATAAPV